MKILTLLFSLTFFLNSNSQDIDKKLQDKTWFVTGDLLKSEKCIFNSEKPVTKTSEVKLADGLINLPFEDDFVLISAYELKNDMLKIHYTVNDNKSNRKENVAHYYKVKELPNKKDFELTPITIADFK